MIRTLPLLLLAGCSPLVVDFKDEAIGEDTSAPVVPDGPDIDVSPLAVDFGVVLVGEAGTAEVLVANAGDMPLAGGVALSGSGAFAVDFTSFSLEREVTQVITVTFAAGGEGVHEGQLTITTNDPDEPTVTVTLRGEAGLDADGDGYGGSDDCDDADESVNPGAEETWYDGVDQDCSDTSDYDADGDGFDAAEHGGTDCDDADAAVHPGAAETWYDGFDQDCSGTSDYDQDADGHDAVDYGGDDCDDTEPGAYPGHLEIEENGIDDDCDGSIDETLSTVDSDGDGYTEVTGDCLEGDPTVNPGATETWYDGVDQDCAGDGDYDQDGDGFDLAVDCDDTDAAVNPDAVETWYDGVDADCSGGSDHDQDLDGYDLSVDCDDLDATINPGAVETWYDGVDQDCSGTSDDDADADGFDVDVDCDDTDAATYPGAAEVWYDGVDQDCSGTSDYDADADGYELSVDCDDTDATVNPGAVESWYDGVDQDCSGGSDHDQDLDGHDADVDCDDLDATVNPGATETWYDGVDQDCSGTSDDDQDGDGFDVGVDCDDLDAAVSPDATETWYDGVDQDCSGGSDHDQDGDGHDVATDCDDLDAAVSPSAAEVCNDADDDCDGAADEGVPTTAWYADVDGDGYGDATATVADCAAPGGYVSDASDCDDTDAAVNPAAVEAEYDATDNDCDGIQDDMAAEAVSAWTVVGERTDDKIGTGGVYTASDLDGDGDPELVIGGRDVDGRPLLLTYTDMGVLAFHDLDTAGLGVDVTDGYMSVYGNSSDDAVGSAFAVVGDVDGGGASEVVVGAYQNDVDHSDDGTVYTLDVDGESGWNYASVLASGAIYGDVANSYTGISLAAGDFDGDGVSEVATGSPGEEGGKGQVYVSFVHDNFGTDDIDVDASQFWIRGVSSGDHLGYAVALGELTGDGYDDLVACSPDDDDGGSNAGTCWLVVGASTRGTATDVQGDTVRDVDTAVVTGAAANDQLGAVPGCLAIGDFDGNGRDDLAIGAAGYGASDGGAVLVYQNGTLSGSETTATAAWLVTGDGALGTALNLDGDVTGDGVDDLLAGAPTAGAAGEGVVYLLEGGVATGTWALPTQQYASWAGAANGDRFGSSVSGLQDLDGDGVLDFAVAAWYSDDGASDAGKVYVLPAYP